MPDIWDMLVSKNDISVLTLMEGNRQLKINVISNIYGILESDKWREKIRKSRASNRGLAAILKRLDRVGLAEKETSPQNL